MKEQEAQEANEWQLLAVACLSKTSFRVDSYVMLKVGGEFDGWQINLDPSGILTSSKGRQLLPDCPQIKGLSASSRPRQLDQIQIKSSKCLNSKKLSKTLSAPKRQNTA